MRSLAGLTLTVWCVAVAGGCHLLVRLGEEPAAEPTPVEQREPEVPERPPAPGIGPETPTPPQPGLSPGQETGAKTQESRLPLNDRSLADARGEVPPLNGTPGSRLLSNTGINFQSAIAPGEGQYVYRTQLRFLQSHSTPGPADVDANLIINPHVLAYGYREDLTLFGMVPFVVRDGTVRPPSPPAPSGAFSDLDNAGPADARFFAKYRFYELDRPAETTRWSVFGGIEVPSYDDEFSSESWDPFLGTVRTYQSQEWGLDWDLGWQFNTGEDVFRHDELFYDAAYTYVLLQGQTIDEKFWQLNSVFEINGSYFTDGSHLVFASPGFQLALERMVVEASLQLPVIRDVKNGLEPDFLFAVGPRITW